MFTANPKKFWILKKVLLYNLLFIWRPCWCCNPSVMQAIRWAEFEDSPRIGIQCEFRNGLQQIFTKSEINLIFTLGMAKEMMLIADERAIDYNSN